MKVALCCIHSELGEARAQYLGRSGVAEAVPGVEESAGTICLLRAAPSHTPLCLARLHRTRGRWAHAGSFHVPAHFNFPFQALPSAASFSFHTQTVQSLHSDPQCFAGGGDAERCAEPAVTPWASTGPSTVWEKVPMEKE